MVRKATRKTFGFILLISGIVLGVLPFVPGILIIIAGLELLGWREAVLARTKLVFKRAKIAQQPVIEL